MRAKSTYNCNICWDQSSGLYALQKHGGRQHGFPTKISNLDMDILLEDIDDTELKEKLYAFKQFPVDSELGESIHSVFNFALSSCNSSSLNEKLDRVNRQLKCAAKVNLAFGFVRKTLKMERVDTVIHTKAKQLRRGLNSCGHKMIWQP